MEVSVGGTDTFLLCSQIFRYSIAFNSTTVHSLPMAVNVLSNALLRGLNGTGQIRTWTKPFDYVSYPTYQSQTQLLASLNRKVLSLILKLESVCFINSSWTFVPQ